MPRGIHLQVTWLSSSRCGRSWGREVARRCRYSSCLMLKSYRTGSKLVYFKAKLSRYQRMGRRGGERNVTETIRMVGHVTETPRSLILQVCWLKNVFSQVIESGITHLLSPLTSVLFTLFCTRLRKIPTVDGTARCTAARRDPGFGGGASRSSTSTAQMTACGEGYYSLLGAPLCTACPAGYRCPLADDSPIACDPGYYRYDTLAARSDATCDEHGGCLLHVVCASLRSTRLKVQHRVVDMLLCTSDVDLYYHLGDYCFVVDVNIITRARERRRLFTTCPIYDIWRHSQGKTWRVVHPSERSATTAALALCMLRLALWLFLLNVCFLPMRVTVLPTTRFPLQPIKLTSV